MFKRISREQAEKMFYAARNGNAYKPDSGVYPFDITLRVDEINKFEESDRRISDITGYNPDFDFERAIKSYKLNHSKRGEHCKLYFYIHLEDFKRLEELKISEDFHFSSYSLNSLNKRTYFDSNFMCGTDYSLGFHDDLVYIYLAIQALKYKKEYITVYVSGRHTEKKYKCRALEILNKNRMLKLKNIFEEIGHQFLSDSDKYILEFLRIYCK